MQVSSQWVWQDGCLLWRTRTQSGKEFPVYGCANTSLNKFSFALATTSIQTHTHLQSCYPAKKHKIFFLAVQMQAWTYSLLHVPKPQSKRTFVFTAATHEQRLCLHASRKQNCTNCVFCAVHVQCTHSARSNARPQNSLNTMGLAFFDNLQKHFFRVFSSFLGKYLVFTPFCGCALWRAL